ncbi:hypothetical protein IID04_06745 [PVC group bacterium]|nr:hypothetical protein [PVC group bacterium]MCH7589548.1 hypothetical protein [PVC group bacterium]
MIKLDVSILNPEKVVFRGEAKSVICPGENGVMEILPHHKRLIGRLLRGWLIVDSSKIKIRKGLIKVALNKVVIIIEEY